MTAMPSADAFLEAALDYAARGWPVLPLHSIREGGGCTCAENTECGSPGKHPRTRAGLKDATTELEIVKLWWGERGPHRGANIGLRTGVAFDVLDCDDTSQMAFWDLASEHGWDPPAGTLVATGSGGLHVYVKPTGLGNRAKFAPHLDWRGEGGYVVAPPSLHASGGFYIWL